MRQISKIIIQFLDLENVDSLISKHKKDGMPQVGFHYMIEKNGIVRIGRLIETIGNHYVGDNASSLGIALIGKGLTEVNELAIDTLLEDLSIKNVDTNNVFIVENGELKKYK